MSKNPVGIAVRCPSCNSVAIAVVPQNSQIVQREDDFDGKVQVNCRDCGESFLTYFRTDT